MDTNLIVMLTRNDRTVEDALDIFTECQDLPIEYWGFKNIGLEARGMAKLVETMKTAGVKTCLEVVTYEEKQCMKAAQFAVSYGFDYLLGTVYYDTVFQFLSNEPIQYFPFCGHVENHPSVLSGNINEVVSHAKEMSRKGVDGFDILAYRYLGDPERLLRSFMAEVTQPVIVAGSIDSLARLDVVKNLKPWGFTIGSALFERKFVPEGSFRDQIIRVIEYMTS